MEPDQRKKTIYPRSPADFSKLPQVVANYVTPNKKFRIINKNTKIITQGSCFAENIHLYLSKIGYSSTYNKILEAMNSPLANYNHLIRVSKTPDSKEFERISTHDVIIITIGVAPCWFRKEDDSFVFSPDLKNINGFYQRTLTVQESSTAISGVINALRVINPRLKIIFTLSPVPLARTFEFDSAIVADCVSKSIIRAALHETLATEQAYYFPSFEIVRWVGAHRGDCFAEEDGLTRHVSEKYIEAIISSFIECFSDSGASTERY